MSSRLHRNRQLLEKIEETLHAGGASLIEVRPTASNHTRVKFRTKAGANRQFVFSPSGDKRVWMNVLRDARRLMAM